MPIQEAKTLFNKGKEEAMQWLTQEVASLRSGRVRPNIVEHLQVESYGAMTPLNGLASISNSDARTLVVSPWDKNTISSIEKAISEAELGVQPVVEGDLIRLSFPTLTDEVRAQVIKVLHNKAEEARVRLRQTRDEALRMLKQDKEKSDITEDDFYDGKKELDEMIAGVNKDIEALVAQKEAEINTI